MASSAEAAFPGQNGQIAFDTFPYEVSTAEPDGSGMTNRSNHPAMDLQPAFSPDGTKIAFHSWRNGKTDVYVMNADGTDQRRLTTDLDFDSNASYSPDGRKIAFVSERDGNSEIYVMNADGSSQTRLTRNPAQDFDPAFSPDGTRIAFTSRRDTDGDGDQEREIYMMNPDGAGETRLTTEANLYYFKFSFSPDGTKIAFSSARLDPSTGSGANADIYLINADGTGEKRLTTTRRDDDRPSFSPDGTKIAFTSTRDERYEVYTMNSDGSEQRRLINDTSSLYRGSASPDWGVRPGTGTVPGHPPPPEQPGPDQGVGPGGEPQPPGGPGTDPNPPVNAKGCLTTHRAGVRGKRLGTARLGRTRRSNRRQFRGARVKWRRRVDRYCVAGGGTLKIAYATKRLNRGLSRSERRRIENRALLIVTDSRRYAIAGIRRGTRVRTLRRRLRGERRFRIGRTNVWYLAPGRQSRLAFKTRRGRVVAVGLADRRLSRGSTGARRLLRAWPL